MKTLFLLLVWNAAVLNQTTTVYVCSGTKVKKYHLSANCRGLRNCQHRIIKMSQEEAQKSGKTLCGWEK